MSIHGYLARYLCDEELEGGGRDPTESCMSEG